MFMRRSLCRQYEPLSPYDTVQFADPNLGEVAASVN